MANAQRIGERSIFLEALDQDDPTQQAAYLDVACAGDSALRERIESLLKSHNEARSFFGKLAPERLADELAAEQTAGPKHDATSTRGLGRRRTHFSVPVGQA